MTSLILRNTFYTILQPGLVAGLIPYLIIRWERVYFWPHGIGYGQLLGLVLMLVGLIIMLWCIINFALKGKGTLSPADPTKKLVVTGLYKFSRNPMYIGVLLILFGEANFFWSAFTWALCDSYVNCVSELYRRFRRTSFEA